MFIAFEWLDGSWSSTQAKLLNDYFIEKWKNVLLTKEPTNLVIWKLIRDILQHKTSVSKEALQLLFCADRADHLDNEIIPALDDWKIVISDRYYFSTIAFWSLWIDKNWLEKLNENFIKPDIIFLFKLDAKECIKRIEKRWNEKELFEKEEILKKVWETYEYLSNKHPNTIIIDATKSIEEIAEEISIIVENINLS